MGLFAGKDDRDERIARLQSDLEKAQIRVEEVAAYYQGQLESVRRRAEDESVRIQAAEAGRRKRAEEQVGYLKGELQSVRADAEHAQRRYQDLRQRLDEMESQTEQNTREEVDRFREAAKAAWKTAEEEVERLDREFTELRRKLEQEREERRQLERSYETLEERHQLRDQERLRLVGRLKRALQASETRRRAAIAGPPRSAASERRIQPSHWPEREVDPATQWGGLALGSADDLSDEFLMTDGDESLDVRQREPVLPDPAPAAADAVDAGEVSDREAETLMMALDVDEQVARRQAGARAPSPPALASTATPGNAAAIRGGGMAWGWLAVAGLLALASAVALLLW